MSYIKKEELINHIKNMPWKITPAAEISKIIFLSTVEDFPTADVVEVRHGEWKTPTTINGRAFNVPHCSVCEGIPCGVDKNTKFCPNCGAKMKGE